MRESSRIADGTGRRLRIAFGIAAIGLGLRAAWVDAAPLPAFPGAEGYGAHTIGGRGGRVIKVTNLNPSGPGSLQAAVAAEGPRIVVFETAGVIRGDIAIGHPYLTIAGQSAPTPGITVEGRLVARPAVGVRIHDVVIRFLRIRPRRAGGGWGDAVQLPRVQRVVLDHLSLSWANDEAIDLIYSSEITIQWSTIEESDPVGHEKGRPHNYAILSAYPGSGNVSIHHNLFAHHARRLPALSPSAPEMHGDFRNNVVYNFRDGLSHEGHVPLGGINVVGNYYKRGPNSERIWPFRLHPQGRYYIRANYLDGVGKLELPESLNRELPTWLVLPSEGELVMRPFAVPPVATQSAQEALQAVMQRAGCFPYDRVTRRTLSEVRQGTGAWERRAPPAPLDDWYHEGMVRLRPLPDADGDGMADHWEMAQGLDPKNGEDGLKLRPSGYTAIEEYLNELAERRVGSGTGS